MPKLLLVEDDASYAQALIRRLLAHGWEGTWYADTVSALAHQREPDAIVLDQNLAGESSLPSIKTFKQLWPNSRVVVVTGYASIATTVSAIKLGADNYLTKPVDVQTLVRELVDHDERMVALPKRGISVDELEWELIQNTLQAHDNNISATARALNMHRRTLQRKLQKKRPST